MYACRIVEVFAINLQVLKILCIALILTLLVMKSCQLDFRFIASIDVPGVVVFFWPLNI